ncbi:hypothetical protein [Roseiarcus sp.]|uniref:hypothetical protein n=1 Tax=Roseiarcus sp. TaxID=1969460 RepID=UPI003C78978A
MYEALFVDLFLEAHERPLKQIILDLDATDDRLHGHQEGFQHIFHRGDEAGVGARRDHPLPIAVRFERFF